MADASLDTSLGDILEETEKEEEGGPLDPEDDWPQVLQSSVIRDDLHGVIERTLMHRPRLVDTTPAVVLGAVGWQLPHDLEPSEAKPYVAAYLEAEQER